MVPIDKLKEFGNQLRKMNAEVLRAHGGDPSKNTDQYVRTMQNKLRESQAQFMAQNVKGADTPSAEQPAGEAMAGQAPARSGGPEEVAGSPTASEKPSGDNPPLDTARVQSVIESLVRSVQPPQSERPPAMPSGPEAPVPPHSGFAKFGTATEFDSFEI